MAKNLRSVDNTLILDAIRKNATTDYRRRIPSATQAGVQAVMKNLFEYKAYRNEFLDALVNKVGLTLYNDITWENPLAMFKRGKLEFGATIEEITVGLIKASTYDHDDDSLEKELFGRAPADVSVQYHSVNREDKYKNTIEMFALKRAFLSENGLGQFVTSLMQAAETSDNWDEFLLMTSLFKEVDASNGFHRVKVPNVSASGSTVADSKNMLRRVREAAANLSFISTHYNALGMPTAAKPEKLVLFITPEANAALDVEALAGAFQLPKAEIASRTVIIPREHFRIPGAQALLTTDDIFVVADTLLETTMQSNAAGLYENYWLHHHQVMSASLAAPSILFTTGEGTVINIFDDPEVTGITATVIQTRAGVTVTSVERGELYNLFNTITVSPTDTGINAPLYTVVGSQSARTFATKAGVLHIGIDEISTSITVEVRAGKTNNVLATGAVAVVGDRVIYLPAEISPDADKDGLNEATPVVLTTGPSSTVTIPTVTGVQYQKAGVNVANGSKHVLTAATTFTATPRAGFEFNAGAVTTYTLNP